ncbi:MAG: polyisoprenoid-binding protein [Candidatus Eisenbacteria bacterium]|nr:polyisoprenoid-binding protein [Candidatus Eisenbacteria bacterium]
MNVQPNRQCRCWLLRAGLLGTFLLTALVAAAAALETYEVDTTHSQVGFKIRHFFSKVPGRFTDFSGTLQYDPSVPTHSRITLTIQSASIDTDNDRRDNHLRSDDFFNVEEFPTITFVSKQITARQEPDRYDVVGDLTIRDVTREVVVGVEMLGLAEIPGMGKRGGFEARTTIDRTDYGVSWNRLIEAGGAMLGDEVEIEVSLEVVRQ